MESITNNCYLVASYSRLSQEDGDKAESDSIKNQKELIRNYINTSHELKIVEEYSDDGYSGVDFERPDFKRMMVAIKEKKINCIVVKDLSRFGRNYIETGRYLEQIFPFMKIRFIAINDNYDSANSAQQMDQILLPFKNLINDSYSRDISIKIRTNLNVKRKKGDYVGAFTPFGYLKSEENKNKLVIDENTADIVRRIFQMRLEGMSNAVIVDTLNKEKVITPYEYKYHSEQGKNFRAGGIQSVHGSWSVVTVKRILENEMYCGHMIQGKTSAPNYKIRKQLPVRPENWIRVENTHEAIISQEDYAIVKQLLLLDTRVVKENGQVYLLSGLLVCGKCGETLIRRKVSSQGETYVYYGCYTKGRTLKCKGISIREVWVLEAVKTALQKHIELLIEMDALIQYIDEIPINQREFKRIDKQIQTASGEMVRYHNLQQSLHQDLHNELINQDEYMDLKNIYYSKEREYEESIDELKERQNKLKSGKSEMRKSVELFRQYRNFVNLDRKMLVTLISKIYVHSNRRIEIHFRYQDEFCYMQHMIEQADDGGEYVQKK